MAQKVKFNNLNNEVVTTFSKYHVAIQSLKKLADTKKSAEKTVKEEIEKIKALRTSYIEEKGFTEEQAVAQYPLDNQHKQLNKIEAEYKEKCKPYMEAKAESRKIIPDYLYQSYALTIQKRNINAKGRVAIGKQEYILTHTLKDYFQIFLRDIGAGNTDNDTAVSNFATAMLTLAHGAKVKLDDKGYVKAIGKTQYVDLIMHVFLQYLVCDKGVWTINKDYTITKTVYENDK